MRCALQEQGRFFLGEFFFLADPLDEFLILGADFLATHAPYYAVVPGVVHPLGKRNVAFLFVVIRNASFGVKKKPI